MARRSDQLGYPVETMVVNDCLDRLLASESDIVVVAEDVSGEKLVGWIHGFLCQLLESDYRVEIGGLVVDESAQRNGIGRALVVRIEQWASRGGAMQASVCCRARREGAHRLCEALGLQEARPQILYRKPLN